MPSEPESEPRGQPGRRSPDPRLAARPLGLTLLMWLYAFWAVAAALVLVLAAVGGGEVAVDGRTVERGAVLEVALPVFLPLALALAGGALAVWLEIHWARSALLLPLALAAVLPALVAAPMGRDPARQVMTGIGIMAVPATLLAAYLYGRTSVRAYFRATTQESRTGRS